MSGRAVALLMDALEEIAEGGDIYTACGMAEIARKALAQAEAAPDALRELCAAVYQVVGAADGPVQMLDNLAAAAEGQALPHDPGAGLPWMPAQAEAAQPVAWMGDGTFISDAVKRTATPVFAARYSTPLYSAPQPAEAAK